jgi:hypothetical protein
MATPQWPDSFTGMQAQKPQQDCTAPIDDDDAHTRFRQRISRECARNAGPNDDDVGLDRSLQCTVRQVRQAVSLPDRVTCAQVAIFGSQSSTWIMARNFAAAGKRWNQIKPRPIIDNKARQIRRLTWDAAYFFGSSGFRCRSFCSSGCWVDLTSQTAWLRPDALQPI